jgi:hypothetical protein
MAKSADTELLEHKWNRTAKIDSVPEKKDEFPHDKVPNI